MGWGVTACTGGLRYAGRFALAEHAPGFPPGMRWPRSGKQCGSGFRGTRYGWHHDWGRRTRQGCGVAVRPLPLHRENDRPAVVPDRIAQRTQRVDTGVRARPVQPVCRYEWVGALRHPAPSRPSLRVNAGILHLARAGLQRGQMRRHPGGTRTRRRDGAHKPGRTGPRGAASATTLRDRPPHAAQATMPMTCSVA